MRTSDTAVAFASWPGGGKRRPIFIISDRNGVVRFYKITSKYQNKSPWIRKQYFPIEYWQAAGLNRQSYIDTITVGRLSKRQFQLSVIGRLIAEDAKQFERFLEIQK